MRFEYSKIQTNGHRNFSFFYISHPKPFLMKFFLSTFLLWFFFVSHWIKKLEREKTRRKNSVICNKKIQGEWTDTRCPSYLFDFNQSLSFSFGLSIYSPFTRRHTYFVFVLCSWICFSSAMNVFPFLNDILIFYLNYAIHFCFSTYLYSYSLYYVYITYRM